MGENGMNPLLQFRSVTIGHQGRSLIEGVDLELHAGRIVALIGVNGGGKSTFLNTIAGLLSPLHGRILVDGKELGDLSGPERARRSAIVFTGKPQAGLLDVRTIVGLGRQPWTGTFGTMDRKDLQMVEAAMRTMDVAHLGSRSLQQISDGEAQRVMIARALAQDTPLLLLDEPMAFLDLVNRVRLLRTLRQLAHAQGKLVLLSTHDLHTSLEFCDQVLLIHQRRLWSGTAEEAWTSGVLEAVFEEEGVRFDRSARTFRAR